MRILGFLESLAELAEVDSRWIEVSAGMLAFRAAENALLGRPSALDALDSAQRDTRRITDLTIGFRLRDLLSAALALDAARRNEPSGRSAVSQTAVLIERLHGQLMAYGMELHHRGDYRMAIDCFRLVSETTSSDFNLRLHALNRRAMSLRRLNRIEDAEGVYREMVAFASHARSTTMRLEGELGLGTMLIDRGLVEPGEARVLKVASDAARAGARVVTAKARRDLARIAGIRNDPVGVVRHTALALGDLPVGLDHDRALVDLGIAFRELGRSEIARNAATRVIGNSAHWDQRIAATLLLFHLALDDRDAATIAFCLGRLSREQLTPIFEAEFHEVRARHAAMRGLELDAVVLVRRMLAVAEQHGLGEVVSRAERALEDLSLGEVPAMYTFRPLQISRRAAHNVARAEKKVAALCAA